MDGDTDDKPYIILRPGDGDNKDPGQGPKEVISSEPLSALFLECPDLLYTITAHHAGYGTVAGKSFYEEAVPDDGDTTDSREGEVRFLSSEIEYKADIVVEIDDGVNQGTQPALDSLLENEPETISEVEADINEKAGYGTVTDKSFYEESVPSDGDPTEFRKDIGQILSSEREYKADIVVEIEVGVSQGNQPALDSLLENKTETVSEVEAEIYEKAKKMNKRGRLRSFIHRVTGCISMPYRRLLRRWRERK